LEVNINFFKIKHTKTSPQQGNVLIAEPGLIDSNFKRSVILLVEHNDKGTIGFTLNRTLDFDIQELLPDFPKFNASIAIGGPVSPNSIQFIHTLGDIVPNTAKVSDGLYWGGDFDSLKPLILQNKLTPRNIRFFIGYSGWDPNQLKGEIKEGSWVVSELDIVQVMAAQEDLWKKAVVQLGAKFKPWTIYPENPSLN
jgi:putative transcriptional regulator